MEIEFVESVGTFEYTFNIDVWTKMSPKFEIEDYQIKCFHIGCDVDAPILSVKEVENAIESNKEKILAEYCRRIYDEKPT